MQNGGTIQNIDNHKCPLEKGRMFQHAEKVIDCVTEFYNLFQQHKLRTHTKLGLKV